MAFLPYFPLSATYSKPQINDERIAIGKGPVGFVNPVLYAHADVLDDITNGKNPGYYTDGFSSVEG